jgi:hypothetical protein
MATKTYTIQICDLCGAEGNLETYRVGHAVGNLRKLDLCFSDAEPIKKLLAGTRPARSRKPRTVFSDEKEIPTTED